MCIEPLRPVPKNVGTNTRTVSPLLNGVCLYAHYHRESVSSTPPVPWRWALHGIEVLGPGLQDVGEADDEVPQGDDGVGADHGQRRALQHGEQQTRVVVADRRTDEEEEEG